MSRLIVGASLAILALAGCATTTSTVTGVPVDVVINALKDRLKLVHPLVIAYKGETGCTDGNYMITAVPTKAQVQLKTVLTDTKTQGLGFQFGTPIVVTPSATVASSNVKTTQTTMNFCVLPETLNGTDGQPPTAECLWTLANKKANYVETLWPHMTEAHLYDKLPPANHERLVTVSANEQPSNAKLEESDLADALKAALGGLMYSNHATACLLAGSMDVQLAFQTTVDTTAGFKVSFVFVNLQDTIEVKHDFTNTMTVTFNFSKGTTPAIFNENLIQ
jgi:hypothetical protein